MLHPHAANRQAGRLDLNSLGMDAATQNHIDELIHKPNGILLVTGPTGSGKTTTLYSALAELNQLRTSAPLRPGRVLTVPETTSVTLAGCGG